MEGGREGEGEGGSAVSLHVCLRGNYNIEI